jgi:hypothetical protein
MSDYRINAYHVMWIFVFFDLPVLTKGNANVPQSFAPRSKKMVS